MKTYRGICCDGKLAVSVTEGTNYKFVRTLDPSPSQRIWNHSPDGFNWGYEGSGPAQLALALLLDHTGDVNMATDLYQSFKRDVVARLPQGQNWELTGEAIDAWMAQSAGSGVTGAGAGLTKP